MTVNWLTWTSFPFSCPFDHVKIYDGYTNEAEVIGVYCGKHRNIALFSTSEALHIEFVTKSGRVEPTRKPYKPYWELEEEEIKRTGFLAEFEISHNFVNLGKYKSLYNHSLKWKCCHFDEIFITVCTGSCQTDNFQCSQWWKFHQNDDISMSVQDSWCSMLAILFCFVLIWVILTFINGFMWIFTHIFQDYVRDTGAIMWLLPCQRNNSELWWFWKRCTYIMMNNMAGFHSQLRA